MGGTDSTPSCQPAAPSYSNEALEGIPMSPEDSYSSDRKKELRRIVDEDTRLGNKYEEVSNYLNLAYISNNSRAIMMYEAELAAIDGALRRNCRAYSQWEMRSHL